MVEITQDLDYKIETKPTYWVVQRERGEYSDYEVNSDYIAANSEEEAWTLYKRYWLQSQGKKADTLIYKGDKVGDEPGDSWSVWDIDIWNLNIIYFKK